MTNVTNGTLTVSPLLWMEYASNRDTGSVIHELIGGDVSVHVAPARPRRVQIELLFNNEAISKLCEDMHTRPGTFTITEPGRNTHSMRYVVAGTVGRKLDPETAREWIVTIEALEVP